ncbi:MAG: helix-turn-helix transcriptional regulator [Tidjanibacter sp.]|nr:helix-turn-helix transcriptional regulator [Tidjanibacter sp.]
MKSKQNFETSQPVIVKYVQPTRGDIQLHTYTRHGIGYVMKGRKYIYSGDVRHEVKQGDLFYLGIGNHYTEDIPDNEHPFEQIVFFYTSDELSAILSRLSTSYNMDLSNPHSCSNCNNKDFVIYPAWNMMKNFFYTINSYIKEDIFNQDQTAEALKMAELIYLISSRNDCCIKSKIMGHIDTSIEKFKQVITDNIFNNISIEELAAECNRSLTSFKKEFKRIYNQSPHKWIINRRLMQSRLLLVSTKKSISEIGNECSFPNTSHFIKLFKKEYGTTPANYRNSNDRTKHNGKDRQDTPKQKSDPQLTAQL